MPSDPLSTRALVLRSCFLVLGWIGITAALFGVGELVVHSHAITTFDRHVTTWAVDHRTPALDATMKLITWLGSWVAIAVAGGVVILLTVTRRLTAAAPVLLAVAWAGEFAMVNLVKHAVDRPRPPRELWLVTANGASFPSGHAANATLVFATATVVVILLDRRRPVRVVTVALGCLAVVAVGYSHVELGVHWTTDVVAGSLVTLVWLAVLAGVLAAAVPTWSPRGASNSRPRSSRVRNRAGTGALPPDRS